MRGDLEFGTTLGVMRISAQRYGAATAIEDGPTRITYEDLPARVAEVTTALATLGIGQGDRVAIWAPNCWEWIVSALAIHRLGAVLVPINTRYKGSEARYILDKAECRAIFTVDGFLGLDFVRMLDRPELPTVVFRTEGWDRFLEAGDGVSLPTWEPRARHVSDILFTSGTTGRPKGAITTHAQTVRAYRDWARVVGLREGDRYLVVAPFFHCFGYKAGWLAALMCGATVLPLPAFDVDEVLVRIERDRVTMLPGPPALYQSLLMRDLSKVDLSSLRLAVTGAASIPVQMIHQMRDVLGFDTVITGYGLTESTGIATMCTTDDDPETIATTSGRAIPGVQVRTVGADGRPVRPGIAGEVVIRGYNVMEGYLDDPEATAQTVVDGWLHTGDIGILDERGYLRITDRLKDMFICGGFNAYPAEIEHTLLEHPAVAEAAVIGIPDERLGEVAMAWIVPCAPLLEEELIAWTRERLANFKVPRRVVFVDALPRNASAKVLKYALRERAAAL